MTDPKQDLREAAWRALEQAGAARFPGTRGRIPNFVGAEEAARRLAGTEEWAAARTLKCNPDSPQRPVRHAALKAGKTVYMAVPRLAEAAPFLVLDPARLGAERLWKASSIKGASELGEPVGLADVPSIDLVVTGCVAVGRDGARLGKGGGYSDLEYAVLREGGQLGPTTPVVSTVHPTQLLDAGDIPMTAHDQSVDLVATPAGVERLDRVFERPTGILWDELDPGRIDAIPILSARRGAG